MKQRITYLVPRGDGVNPEDIQVTKDSVHYKRADQAAEEWRLTLEINDVPQGVGFLSSGRILCI